MLQKLILALAVSTAAGVCVDDPFFLAEDGMPCTSWASMDCLDNSLSVLGKTRLLNSCQLACDSCVKAADFCEIGVGGDVLDVSLVMSTFDLIEQPFLNQPCEWQDSPQGLMQISNAWGNFPGENVLMGCMAILKGAEYTDFIMEVEAFHEDNDASGFIFGMDAANPEMFYQVMMHNDQWPDDPTDKVPGPFVKFSKKNGKPCAGTMTNETDCYDLLGYSALALDQPLEAFPKGRLASMVRVPAPYHPAYDFFKSHNADGRTVKMTLVVYQGEARVYFPSRNNRIIGLWIDLPADYVGGRVGLFMSAHQATYSSYRIADLSASASPFTNMCSAPGATCDTNVGLCLGGPTFAPTGSPSVAPTYTEECNAPHASAAAMACPGPVGGNVITYDTTTLSGWELIDQAPISVDCEWAADADGITQTTNAWGNYPSDNTLIGCMALVPESYTDFIAEYDAVHFDNDAWGFIFGYKGPEDNYIAHTINDVWPGNAVDGIRGPNSKLRKTTGTPCLVRMNESNVCYETLGYTDANGYSDFSNSRTVDAPRHKEYEYTHPYAASASWQPHKITLIVQDQEARILYKSPDSFTDYPINNVRQSQRFQAAMSYDLKGYTGGRVGIWMYAHQMVVSNFKITDLSDPANMPTSYCSGTPGAYCDVGYTGLCLAVAASDVCEGATGAGVDVYDTQDVSAFEYIDDPYIDGGSGGGACIWGLGNNGYIRQNQNSWGNLGAMLGCNAILSVDKEYTDFIAEMWIDNLDNDGVGFNFGWKSLEDHFRVHKMTDPFWGDQADGVNMPHFKIQRRVLGTSCQGTQTFNASCYQTIAFVDDQGVFHADRPAETIAPAGECGYATEYLPYDEGDRSKMYLIVKNGEARATYESPLSRRQVTVMAFDLLQYGYAGGKIGLFTYAHQAEFYELKIADLSTVSTFCDGTGTCSERTGRCLGAPTVSPTQVPTNSPTAFPTPNVAANEFCQGAVSSTATTIVDTTDISQFSLVDHPQLTTSCAWSTAADGLTQSSDAWGNSPGDNTLMGCMAIFQAQTYTDFIAEIDVTHIDNDGWGIVFGYKAIDDHYLGIAMNDRWPLPAADGIGGPFLKMKKHNGKPVLPTMDASNTCFDKISHLDSFGFDGDAMQSGGSIGLPKEYEGSYPYAKGAQFADTKITLIVKGQEARLYYPTPGVVKADDIVGTRSSQKITSTWTFDLGGYSGGNIGVFTYSHLATFNNWKITDISDESAISAYCDGVGICDNQRGDASTGLCFSVPAPDVCEGPVGDSVLVVDTSDVLNQRTDDFTYLEDAELSTPGSCEWGFGPLGHLMQFSNAGNSYNGFMAGCLALVTNVTMTDFIAQVDIRNDDNDGVGFVFGVQALDDHFRAYKIRDNWPTPSYDNLGGNLMKVMRRNPGVSCDVNGTYTATNLGCYTTISYIDPDGSYHSGVPTGFVSPFEYSATYLPFAVNDEKRLVLIVRDNTLRMMYNDVDTGKMVGSFAWDLADYSYNGGGIGLLTIAHQSEFYNFVIAPLSGEDAVTQFCNGGTCDTTKGICLSAPTQNPTSVSVTDVAVPNVCPGAVGGATTVVDTLDLTQFTFVDQEPISEECAWEIVPGVGLKQTSNAWGNYPGDSTALGCLAIIGTETYTDFMIEVTAEHDDDDGFGFVFGYDGKVNPVQHIMAEVNNDKWPDPPMDGVRGPYAKIKKTNDKPCVAAQMNATADNMCYDTMSFNDYLGRFNIDGEMLYDVPGDYHRRYPFKVDEPWPTRTLTLIVKDGEARLMIKGNAPKPPGSLREYSATQWVGTWTRNLADFSYVGGQVGLFTYAHQLTFYDLKITDLSDAANLPTGYCNGMGSCLESGVCVSAPASEVCEDPVGSTVVDMTSMSPWDFIQDDNMRSDCQWQVEDLGAGPLLWQSSNAYSLWNIPYLGCNALYKDPADFTDFIMQMDVDIRDNDGFGFIFGWKSDREHFKLYKRLDPWPTEPDGIAGPYYKLSKRVGELDCVEGMNETTACYQGIAWSDDYGVLHADQPDNTVTPYQYLNKYNDYEISRGDFTARMVLIIKDNMLRSYVPAPDFPNRKVPVFAFDLAKHGYTGGKIGFGMMGHQVQMFNVEIARLSGAGAATSFCSQGGTCNTAVGLCE